jgi:hypothetical protein
VMFACIVAPARPAAVRRRISRQLQGIVATFDTKKIVPRTQIVMRHQIKRPG